MIKITQLKFNKETDKNGLIKKASRVLHVKPGDIGSVEIIKSSIDARKKNEPLYVYSVALSVKNEEKVIKNLKDNKNVSLYEKTGYKAVTLNMAPGKDLVRPVVIGFGPAGMFAAYLLALNGLRPLVLERGCEVSKRKEKIETFWNTGELDENSNVQFGEGGAGTFSDGKLSTMVGDRSGRKDFVLDTFVKFGAPENIRTDSKPHIGSDLLVDIVKNLRLEIIRLGGDVRFNSLVTGFYEKDGRIVSLQTSDGVEYAADKVILAPGHSARDTFGVLKDMNIRLERKSFAVGVRVEHPRILIDKAQYGENYSDKLPAAVYKLTHRAGSGRGVYSFCMCPGGYVVNSSGERGALVVNGMSYSGRSGINSNSAIVVTVTEKDFGEDDVLSGVRFQRELEKKAFEALNGLIPVQRFADFKAMKVSDSFGTVISQSKGKTGFYDLNRILPEYVSSAIKEGIGVFGSRIKGFDGDDVVLSGVESRTSSPVRIVRDERLEASLKGLIPCGEGAGYAGGIMSAAMDGLKCAERIITELRDE
ncbi:MAG: FAD-dependent oxidoreductase [Lachnospiraceae bacterium]|nr:FAD-dependent oxidoreductase [Lachnospiraceae bacterium]